jgi:hypothetical protein
MHRVRAREGGEVLQTVQLGRRWLAVKILASAPGAAPMDAVNLGS